ncbi:hypothetical protein V494_00878 [Pseudogymnoascus sp. VKM F-4513 (FW-928)]|nr:hypothetical protein V494_00878 [Pseudogymnoascus sp. VKM F-4513 (FW-928)]
MASASYKLNSNGIPAYEDLPLQKGDPHHSAWGLYGPEDELGTLNRLTDDNVLAAAKGEIKTGARVSLNWPLTAQGPTAFFGREVFHQKLIPGVGRTVNDDVWTFNSQVTSQWDSLRHFAYQAEERFYNGVTMADILGAGDGSDGKGGRTTRNGIQVMAEKGIVGRGVLLDYYSWWQRNRSSDTPIDGFKTHHIRLEDLLATAKEQGTEIHFGDILLIRSGYMASLATKATSEVVAQHAADPPTFIGMEQSEEALRWLWENFAAVAGDQPTFEGWPSLQKWSLHEVLLSGWGCPIGELFDLEKLAVHCEKEKRWSFFVTSEVCNVPGGVARSSPPNILAIF